MDADGRVDLNKPSQSGVARDEETALESKLVAMLEPMAGAGNVRATVNVSYTQGTEERTDETYDPQSAVQVSVQRTEQSSQQMQRTAAGAAGTASNTGSTNPVPVNPTAGNGQQQTAREENSAYAVSRHLVHTQEGPGRVSRIAAAIVVNDVPVPDPSGKQTNLWKARTPDDMRRLEQLAQAAVGFDTRRGDVVVVQNIAFTSNAPIAKPAMMDRISEGTTSVLRSQPGLLKTIGTIACAGLLMLFVLRPMVKSVSNTLNAPPTAPSSIAQVAALAGEEEDTFVLSGGKRDPAQQMVFDRVANHVRDEKVHTTRVLQAWISAKKENE